MHLTILHCQVSKVQRCLFFPQCAVGAVLCNDSPHPLRPNTHNLCSFIQFSRHSLEKQAAPEMKEVTPLHSDSGPDLEALHYSHYSGQSLENRILTQASSFLLQPPSWMNLSSSCAALHPSNLSSTTSSSPLLSTSSSLLSSSLLSTENTQLKYNPLTVSSLCSAQPQSSLIQSTAPPTGAKAPKYLSGEDEEIISEEDELCSIEEILSYSEELNEVSFLLHPLKKFPQENFLELAKFLPLSFIYNFQCLIFFLMNETLFGSHG